MKCKKHPSYEAKRQPTSACVECHAIWRNKQVADEEQREARERAEDATMHIKSRMFRNGGMKI